MRSVGLRQPPQACVTGQFKPSIRRGEVGPPARQRARTARKFNVDDTIKLLETSNDPIVRKLAAQRLAAELEIARKDVTIAVAQKELVEKDKKAITAQLLRVEGQLSARGFVEFMESKLEELKYKGERNERWASYFKDNQSLLDQAKARKLVKTAAAAGIEVVGAYKLLSENIHQAKFLTLAQGSGDAVFLGPPLTMRQAQLLRVIAEANSVEVKIHGFGRANQ